MRNLGATLAHISTISIGGYSSKNNILCLTEQDFNIGQVFNNQVYMITKYLAEYNVLTAINNNKIKGYIFRLGNIMPRYSDGKFQHNKSDNAFISRLHTFMKIHAFTNTISNIEIDLSPVDLCAKSILKLMQLSYNQTIYHIYNNHYITLKELFNKADIKYEIISKQSFINEVKKLDSVSDVHILNDLNKTNIVETKVNNEKTTSLLNTNHFYWNEIDKNYLNTIL